MQLFRMGIRGTGLMEQVTFADLLAVNETLSWPYCWIQISGSLH